MKKMIITGNAGRNPELRAGQNGEEFVIFSVAVAVGTKQSPKTDWIDVTCNGKLAEIAHNYIKKGTKLLIEGFPSANCYIDRDNKPVASLKIYANFIELLGKKEEEQLSNNDAPNYTLPESKSKESGLVMDDDIPF
jgi:single-strand DNA-binding protein